MTRTSRDRKIIFVLLIALAVQVFLLLAHTGVIRIGRKSGTEGVLAGHISEAHNHLRRRSLNSLVWENSQKSEAVYFHDSVLTLKGSTATLALDNSTQVELSENTLITIEPPDEHNSGEIRLRFVRGNLQARNPYQKSRIAGEKWSVDVKQGSQLELREIGEGGVEVVLKGGEGSIQTTAGTGVLRPNEIVRIGTEGAGNFAIDSKLKWLNSPLKRSYLHGEALPLPLEWQGQADTLVIQTLGIPERRIAVNSTRYLADLSFGNHRLYLRSGTRSSEPLDVQVWRAPLIHLLAPLPRNRVEVGDTLRFLWQKPPEVAGFRLGISGAVTKVREEQQANEFTGKFSAEDDVQWSVEGIDRDGYAVPPLYRYPLFIRERPLPAPKLKKPELRAPAAKPPGPGAWLWSQIFPRAHAEEFHAVFSWEEVPGANQYVIEISESADFRNPVVNITVKTPEFVWQKFRLANYYWRVAAGHTRGRMGVFTEPVTVDFSPLKKNSSIAALDGVLIKKIITAAASAAPVPPAPPPEPAVVAPQAPPAPEPLRKVELSETQKHWQPIALWQPRYGSLKIHGSDSVAVLTGATIPSFGLEVPWRDAEGAIWMIDAAITHYSFKPDPESKFPFQKDLNWLEFDANLLRFRSPLGYGFSARQNLSVRRTDYEAIAADTVLGFGPIVQWNLPVPRGDFNIRTGLIFNRDGQVFLLAPEWRGRIGQRFVTGFGAEAQFVVDVPDFGYSIQGFATIGFPF
jgi:ribosomal protein L12E/L44/L45/RPP1/RPP2